MARRLTVVVAVAALVSTFALVGPPAASAAETLLAVEGADTSVDASSGIVVWSSFDPASRRFRLKALFRGRVEALPVRSRAVPFDVNVGRDRHRRRVAVYSRCGREGPDVPLERCDVFVYHFASRRERRVRRASTRGWSERTPAIWGRYLAFVRVRERKRRVADAIPRLRLVDMVSGRVRRLFGGAVGEWEQVGSGDDAFYLGGGGPAALDLRGRTLVFSSSAFESRCNGRRDPSGEHMTRTEVWASCRSPESVDASTLIARSI